MTMNGFKVPGWAVAALLAAAALVGFGYRAGAAMGSKDERFNRIEAKTTSLDYRLCRIEKALSIAPYETCQ